MTPLCILLFLSIFSLCSFFFIGNASGITRIRKSETENVSLISRSSITKSANWYKPYNESDPGISQYANNITGLKDIVETFCDNGSKPRIHRSAERVRFDDYDDHQNYRTFGGRLFSHSTVSWRLKNYPTSLDESDVTDVFRRAFKAYRDVAMIEFQQTWSTSPDIDIEFMDSNYDTNCEKRFTSKDLAHCAWSPTRLHFNGANTFTIDRNGHDLFTIAMHEIGHALGLAHSNYNDAIMTSYYIGKRSGLTSDDIRGIQALYGARSSGGSSDSDSGILCKSGAFYCGHELTGLGYKDVISNALYECDNDHDGLYRKTCRDSCSGGPSIVSYCPCQVGGKYCGHELRYNNWAFSGLTDHMIYQCKESHRVSEIETCSYICRAADISWCTFSGATTCTPGVKYCGYELSQRKFTDANQHHLYECTDDNNANRLRICFSNCIESTSDSSCNGLSNMASKPE